MTNEAFKVIEISAKAWFRLFSACQALTLPTMSYGVTHERAREIITTILGFCPKGKPCNGTTSEIQEFLSIEYIEHDDMTSLWISTQGECQHEQA